MSRCLLAISHLIDSGLGVKNNEQSRTYLMKLHYFLQEEVKVISSSDYRALVDLLSSRLSDFFQSQTSSDHLKALQITLCVICCGGALFNDLKSNLHYWLLTLGDERSIENDISELMSLVLAHYVTAYGPIFSEKIDNLVSEFLLRIARDKSDYKRIISIRCLREIGAKSPSNLYRFMDNCLRVTVPLLQDSKLNVRTEASKFLCSILWAINSREFRIQQHSSSVNVSKTYYSAILDSVSVNFRKSGISFFSKSSVREEVIHGSILTLYEFYKAAVICLKREYLVTIVEAYNRSSEEEVFEYSYSELHAIRRRRISGSLLSQTITPLTMLQHNPLTKFRAPFSCMTGLKNFFKPLAVNLINFLRAGKNSILVSAALKLIPWLCAFDPIAFVATIDLDQLVNEIVLHGKRDKLAYLPMITLSLLSRIMPQEMFPYSKQFIDAIQAELLLRDINKKTSESNSGIFLSLGILAACFGEKIAKDIHNTLESMFHFGLSKPLIDCLEKVVENVPSLRQDVRAALHSHIAFIVIHKSAVGVMYGNPEIPISEIDNSALLLALQTLKRFDFDGYNMINTLDVLCEKLLEHESKFIRIQSLHAICKILLPFTKCMSYCNIHGPPAKDYSMIASYVRHVIRVGISDADPDVRYSAISVLDDTPELNYFIARPDNLNILLYAINDEIFEIREVAISLTGQLSNINPACVLSSLRRFLLELVYLLNTSSLLVRREQAVHSIGGLVSSAPRLMSPFMHSMMEVLMSAISRDISYSLNVAAVQAIGEYAQISSGEIIAWVDKVVPVLLKMLTKESSSECKEVSLWTMTRIIQSGGYMFNWHLEYPKLVPMIMELMDTDPSKFVHNEGLKLLGALGTRKFAYSVPSIKDTEEKSLNNDCLTVVSSIKASVSVDDTIVSMFSGEQLYGIYVLQELLTILNDISLKFIHERAVDAISVVLSFLDTDLANSMRDRVTLNLLTIIQSCTSTEETTIFIDRLAHLISKFGLNNANDNVLSDITNLIQNLWHLSGGTCLALLKLASCVAVSAGFYFESHANKLLPILLKELNAQSIVSDQDDLLLNELFSLLVILSQFLEQHMQVIIPYIIDIIVDHKVAISSRRSAVLTLTRLVELVDARMFTSGILVPLMRIGSSNSSLKTQIRDCIILLGKQVGSDLNIFKRQLLKAFPGDMLIENLIYDSMQSTSATFPILQIDRRKTSLSKIKSSVGHSSTSTSNICRSPTSLNIANLVKNWEWAQELCKEDVSHWFQAFRLGFFTESTSPSINACRTYFLDSYNIIVARLFNISFMSCWASLGAVERDKLVCCISHVLSTFDDAEFGRSILELVEFFDHHSTIGCLPFDLELLSKKSIQLRAYASALQYAEKQFQVLDKCNNTELIETLISVNNELDQLEAAHGALMYARYQNMPIKELWYEKLGHWSRALRDYEFRQSNDPANSEILLGRMRCLEALGDWSQLHDLCSEKLKVDTIKFGLKQQIANIAAPCAWALESWDSMSTAVSNFVNNDTLQSRIYSAVLMLKQKKYRETHNIVRAAWGDLHLMYTSLFTRDYSHINDIIGQAQSLIELEEVIQYASIEYRRPMLRNLWRTRLTQWCEDDFYVWYRSLLIQSIVLPPLENQRQWIALVDLCSKTGKEKQANHIFATMLNIKRKEPITIEDISGEQHPFIYFAFLKHKRTVEIINSTKASMNDKDWSNFRSFVESLPDAYSDQAQSSLGVFDSPIEQMERDEHKSYWRHFKAECYYTLAQRTIEAEELNDNAISRIQKWFETAISYQSNWREIWNDLANFHYKVIMSVHYSSKLHGDLTEKIHDRLRSHVIQCHNALYKSILLGTPISALQNILRFITLWFQFGNDATILRSLNGLLSSLPVETWLQVIPQLISRIDCKQINVAKSVQQLLASIGRKHPQALIYSLAVASKSDNNTRQAAANSVLISLRHHSDTLVQQALLISEELIRISILWHEHWYGALDEASRLNINEHDIKGCLELLLPLHKQLEKGGETLAERAFIDTYGQDLERAYEHWKRYRHNNEEIEVSTAWQIYYKVYNALRDQLAKTTTLDLKYVSPKLLNCRNLELAIPGTYEENKDESSIISIQRIDQQITVISSKQRPRKLSMMGSDGKRYLFLLKGHEDLRQDQRAMQLFVLINSILAEHPETSRRDLAIGRYSVVPLAPDNGLISWLHQCDTLHSLIRQYREETKIPVYLEYSMIKHECPFYGRIPLLARIEVFRRALSKSDGLDLARIIWNKSPNADVWFTRRTNYVRSLAVMSMVGYIIGLGDRHPSNLMIDRFSGKVIHIDFGDCFEVAMKRKRFPETIPFRLTRMLINAMEVTGEQGIFRQTCQIVMALMRRNRESLIAVLEAFVYDPLASWRLNVTDTSETYSETEGDVIDDLAYQSNDVNNERPFAASISIKARYKTDVFEGPEMLNNQALAVLRRVKHKLTGKDFPLENENEYLSPEEQVTLLIKQAKSEENLCRCYFGWCPFW